MSIKNLVLCISCMPVYSCCFKVLYFGFADACHILFLLVYMCVCVCYSVNSTHILLSCLQTYAYVKI